MKSNLSGKEKLFHSQNIHLWNSFVVVVLVLIAALISPSKRKIGGSLKGKKSQEKSHLQIPLTHPRHKNSTTCLHDVLDQAWLKIHKMREV